VVLLAGSATASVSAAGDTTPTLASTQPNVVSTITAGAGAGGYTHNIVLSSTNAHAGAFLTIHVDLAASRNPRIEIRDLTNSGTILGTAQGNNVARRVTFRCVFDGTNWGLVSRAPAAETFEFDVGNFTLAIPTGALNYDAFAVAPGAGGGSGRRGAAGSARFGGGGGSAGNVAVASGSVASIGATTLNIDVSAGGAGGAPATADDTNGNAGTGGTFSRIRRIVNATGSVSGGGGTAAAGAGGAASANTNRTYFGGAGGSSSVSAAPSQPAFAIASVPNGGGAGGGISAANVDYAGGTGLLPSQFGNTSLSNNAGGAAGGGAGLNGDSSPELPAGIAGSGGGGNAAGAGGAGGHGYRGSGGAGGGASVNGSDSGAGGNGGDGYARITLFY
jgi:hypothetical protein